FNVRREMTSNLELFVDSSYTVNITPMKRGSLLSALRIPSSSALNPFNEEVLINFPGGPAAPMTSESTVTRVSAGGSLKLPRGWQLQGDYAISEGDNWCDLGSGLSTSMVAAVAAGTLNPFVDTQTYPVDLSPYLQQFVGDYGS